jgi:signal transduction histidine kinase
MKRVLLFVCLLFLCSHIPASALADHYQRVELQENLNRLPARNVNRLPLLYQLAKLAGGVDWKYYPSMLLTESRQLHSRYYETRALYLLVSYGYYNNDDSIFKWASQLEPQLLMTHQKMKYFAVRTWVILRLGELGKFNMANDSIRNLYRIADSWKSVEGRDISDGLKGAIEMLEGKSEIGAARIENALTNMRKHDDSPQTRVFVLRYLSFSHPSQPKRLFYLRQLAQVIEKAKELKLTEFDPVTPVYLLDYLVDRNYAREYIMLKDFEKAMSYLKLAEKDIKDHDLGYRDNEIGEVYMDYYLAKGNYEDAVTMMDSLIQINKKMHNYYDVAKYYKTKGDALMKLKRNREAQASYSSYYVLSDSLRLADYRETLARVRENNDVNKLQLSNREMELKALHTNENLRIMYVIFVTFAIATLIFIYLLVSRSRATKRLKAEQRKAEEADKMKSAFLANMSHEIRTPLNAIVGFSQLIIEEPEQSLRAEYSEVIQSSNEQLQRIISDVLDISKIESNTVQLFMRDQDLPAVMNEIRFSVSSEVPPEIDLHLDDCKPCYFSTDRGRLKQILSYLIFISIGKIKKGYICFGYELGDKDTIVFYVRTDHKMFDEKNLNGKSASNLLSIDGTEEEDLKFTIVQGLTEKMNGRLEIQSDDQIGTLFRVVFSMNV